MSRVLFRPFAAAALGAVLLGAVASPAMAVTGGSTERSIAPAGRVYGPATPCAALGAAVSRSGALVIGTGPGTYDRVVRDIGFCPVEQTTRPAYTPAADASLCFVGYRCRDRDYERDRRF